MPFQHTAVNHSVGEHGRGQTHTNGVESIWLTLKRAYKRTFLKLSPMHLDRHIQEFAGHHNLREQDTTRENSEHREPDGSQASQV